MLSKSQYVRGLQCEKSLWLYKNQPEIRSPPDEQAEIRFRIGNLVGDYAKSIFPGGVEIEFDPKDYPGMDAKTWDAIENGAEIIYEATFSESGVFAMVDILLRTELGWNMYEVKSSTKVKPYHINDASVQWYALGKRLPLNRAFIVHLNNTYEKAGVIEPQQLFTIVDVTEEVIARQIDIPGNLSAFENMISGEMPVKNIGPHCSDPFECDFHAHCWSQVPHFSVFNLYRLATKRKFELYGSGVVAFEDINEDISLSDMQKKQVKAKLTGEIFVDKAAIRQFLDGISLPVSFFDFETFQNAIPRFDGQRPYMQLPFQYSLHIVDAEGRMTHCEFLGDHMTDPRRALCEKLLADIPAEGPIVAFNMSFEISRIREMSVVFPEWEEELITLTDRFVDLLAPFRDGAYYHTDFNGSFSIKSVLPALFPDDSELSYKSLAINDGGMASDTFANLYLLEDLTQLPQIRADLLAYCRLDTLGMVRIWEKLRDIVRE